MTRLDLPCPATESLPSRALRLAASAGAVLASALIAGASLVNLMGFRQDSHRAASLAFALTSLLLVASCFASIRQPRRGAAFVCAAATALTLGFTDLGRGLSGLTFKWSGVTHYVVAANFLVLLLGVILLCIQVAASLARRHGCNCG